MRTETLWQGERRAARLHWWRQVLDRPAGASWEEVFDEMVVLRFGLGEAGKQGVQRSEQGKAQCTGR